MTRIAEEYGDESFEANLEGESIRQPFLAVGILRAVSIPMQLRCDDDCRVCIGVSDESGELGIYEFFGNEVADDRVETIFNLRLKPGALYELVITFTGKVQNVKVMWGEQDHVDSLMSLGDLKVRGELNVRFEYDESEDEKEKDVGGDESDRQRQRWMSRAFARSEDRRLEQEKMRKVEAEEKKKQEEARLPGGEDCSFGFSDVFDADSIGIEFNSALKEETLEGFLRMPNLKVSIIILTKDKPEVLQKCLSRIQEHVGCDYEVVIGDTGSSDPGVDEVYRDLPPNCKVIRGLDYHFSKANNYLAREHATGSFLLFMNNDVYLERDSVSDVVKALRAYPIGTVGVRLVRENGMIDHDGQTLFRDGSIREPAHESDGKKAQNVPEVDVFVEGNTAAFMMTRRGVFEAVGGFDEDYEDIYQDCDFALKVIGLGFKHLCLRSAPAVHLGSLTRGKGGNEVDLERYLNRWAGFYFLGCFSPFFSFITCCSNADIYLQMFRTLPPGGGTIELLPVQNRDNFFTVTEALNLGQRLSSGKYSVFCHQDVLYNEAWFKDVVKSLKALEERSVGVIGFEGVRVQDEKRAVKGWRQLGQPGYMEVQTVDEYCLIAEKGQFWFDEQFRFHFYGVDICLQALKRGLMNYVIYGRSEHVSGGDQNIKDDPEAFRSEVRNLWKKWGEAHTHIATTTVSLTSEGLKYYLCRDVLGEEESCLSSST